MCSSDLAYKKLGFTTNLQNIKGIDPAAMGNAQSEIKAAADVVTGTNDEDGIVSVIEQYILNA